MPWTKSTYPPSMKNLPKEVRDKAVEIANALLEEEGMDEGIVIATAISRAKDWAANRGKNIEATSPKSKTTDVKEHGKDRYVIPKGKDWAVKEEGQKSVEKVYHSKKAAIDKATKEAKKSNASITVQRKNGKLERRTSFNPNRRAKKQS